MAKTTPVASYSLTARIRIANMPGMLGKVTSAIGEAGGDIGAVDIVEAGGQTMTRDVTFKCLGRGPRPAHRGRAQGGRRRHGGQRVRPHVPDAPRREDRGQWSDRGEDARRSLDGVHARRGAGVHGHPRRSGEGLQPHDQAEHGGRRHRRLGGAGPRGHRPRRRDPRDGGQVPHLQVVRRRRCVSPGARHEGRRRDRAHGQEHRADLRRGEPRGYLRPALLRDRGAPAARSGHPGLPRRPARDGGGDARRAHQRAQGRQQEAQRGEDRLHRRGRERHRDGQAPHAGGRANTSPRATAPARSTGAGRRT